jgi:hypothetical protein
VHRVMYQLVLAVCLVAATCIAAAGQSDKTPSQAPEANMSQSLASIEQRYFSHTYSDESVHDRMDRIEKLIFGEASTESDKVRFGKLQTFVPSTAREPAPQLLKASLPPVPFALSAGNTYLTSSISKTEPDNWFRIPQWLAGKWYSDLRWTTSDSAEPAGTHFPRRTGYNGGPLWGVERDAKGNIWHRLHPPEYEHQPGPNNQTTNSVIDQEDLIASSDESLCERIHRFRTRVDSAGVIIDTFQDDIVKTLTPAHDGTIVSIQVVREFDQKGNLRRTYTTHQEYKRTEDFSPNSNPGIRNSFKTYLLANNLDDLVPADLRGND